MWKPLKKSSGDLRRLSTSAVPLLPYVRSSVARLRFDHSCWFTCPTYLRRRFLLLYILGYSSAPLIPGTWYNTEYEIAVVLYEAWVAHVLGAFQLYPRFEHTAACAVPRKGGAGRVADPPWVRGQRGRKGKNHTKT